MHKRNGVRAALRGKRVAVAVAAAFVPLGDAYSLPTGENVVHGSVQVTRPTAETMQINQATQKGIVNWQGFSIGSTEHVNITQPNSSASLLNRVVGNDPSSIFGRLTANGQVFLVNNAGVFFAPGASVEVGALVASTLSITDQNFINGIYQFYNPGNAGSVLNQGSIVTASGYTALIGPQVRNDGVIIANSGKIALGAGDRVSLDMIGDGLVSISVDQAAFNASVINTGTLHADGTVFLKASSANALLDTVINTSGVIRASGLGLENGVIVLHGGDAGAVQVAGTVQAESGRIEISAAGALNVGSTVCCSPTTVIAATEQISAGSITVGGGAQIISNTGAGTQTVTTPGTLLVLGGVVSGDVGLFHNGTGEQRITAGSVELRGGTGTNTGAFIRSNAGGDQTVTATGSLTLTGGASGIRNRAGIESAGKQTIDGNPDIVLTGGAGGGAGNDSNNVFIRSNAPDTDPLTPTQKINARSIQITAGKGVDASATFNAARQQIITLGNVSLFGDSALGAPSLGGASNGARIGGIGGDVLGPTNLTLNVGGNLRLRGIVNGASLGSSGASIQPNTIAVSAAGDITLESVQGAGARIGSSNQTPVPSGNITVTAGTLANPLSGRLQLGTGTAIRANGPITLTANSLTNQGTITNGGGTNSQNVVLVADAFGLAGGNVQAGAAGVFVRPRTNTNTFGIESAGPTIDTTFTNADIASINTSNFVVFGSGANLFHGNVIIGQDALVTGGAKNLAVIRSTNPGGTTTIGNHGVTTAGDLIISAGGGAIVSNGGIVAGDEIQLRATQGIGAFGARVNTAANALTIGTAGNAFVAETNDVTMRTIVLNLAGNTALNTTNTGTGGMLDLTVGGTLNVAGPVSSGQSMNLAVTGALNVTGAGAQDAVVTSNGGQTIAAHSVSLTAQDGRRANIENVGGDQTVSATAGNMNLQVPSGFGVAQIVNTSPGGNQTISAARQINVLGGATSTGSTNSGIFKNGAGGLQAISASGITLRGASSGTNAGALISSQGNQLVNVGGGNIILIGGSGGQNNNAGISASSIGQQTVFAHDINLANGVGGIDTAATILGGNQLIDVTGSVTLTSQGSLVSLGAAALPGVRIGAPGGSTTGTNLRLLVDGNLVLQGGSAANNGAAIGSSSGGPARQNTIDIDVGGSVVLNSGSAPNAGARIGYSSNNGPAGGNITITADGAIELNGTGSATSIQTLGNVTLNAASISEAALGTIVANTLNTSSSGSTLLTGQDPVSFLITNQVSNFNGTSGGDLRFFNRGPLTVTGVNAAGQASLVNALGDVTLTGQWTSSTASIFSGAAIVESGAGAIQAASLIADAVGVSLTGANQVGVFDGRSTIDLTINNAAPLELARASASGSATLTSAGDMTISGPVIANNGISLTANGGSIVETGAGSITTGAFGGLSTFSSGDTTLNSFANQVSLFNATSGGDVSLVTTGFLTVTGVNAAGTSTITAGDLSLSGTVTSTDVVLTAGGSISQFGPASGVIANTLATVSGGNTTLAGENRVAAYSGTSGGDLFFFNRGALDVTSLSAVNANVSNEGTITISGPWSTSTNTTISASGFEGALVETPTGFIQTSGHADLFAQQSIDLGGPNQINGTLSLFAMHGDVNLANAGSLNVTSLNAVNASVTNHGPMTISGFWTSSGASSISTEGVGADLNVRNFVSSNGAMTVDVDGTLRVEASGFQSANLRSFGGQDITAGAIEVTSRDGQFASLSNDNNAAGQRIHVNGGAIDVQTFAAGGLASIANNNSGLGGAQVITLADADHVKVNGLAGLALITTFGAQTIAMTGAGNNALTLGSVGAQGVSQIFGSAQAITAGDRNLGEPGSIELIGSNAPASFNAIVTNFAPGVLNTQNVSTSGALTIRGGNSPFQPPVGNPPAPAFSATGIAQNASGAQNIQAGAIVLQGGGGINNNAFISSNQGGSQNITAGAITLVGGASGQNNGAIINSSTGGNQTVSVSGGAITVTGGAGGVGNRAGIVTNAIQTIDGNPDIVLTGGGGGVVGNGNNVFIQATGPDTGPVTPQQTINAHSIRLASGAGTDASATLNAARQAITTTGDVSIFGSAGPGGSNGARIGGIGGTTLGPTNLTLNAGGSVLLHGGTVNGASLGSSGASTQANTITVNAAGNITLKSDGAGARIGSSSQSGATPGNITITADGAIELNGTTSATAIRTLGNVTLTADHITEAANGFIVAGTLNTTTQGDQILTGPNQVASFTASSETGNVSLRNTAPVLTLGSMNLPGALLIDQTGTLSIPGTVSALSHAIEATGDVLVGSAGQTSAALLYAPGDISIETAGSLIVRASDVTPLAASAVVAGGNLHVAAGNVSILAGGALLTPAAMLGQAVDIYAASELRVRGGSGHCSPALLASGGDINLTIGNAVRVDRGSGFLSPGRLQSAKDDAINITFLNVDSGGYFVNGIEGRIHQGDTGFFTLHKPAKLGDTLLVEYAN